MDGVRGEGVGGILPQSYIQPAAVGNTSPSTRAWLSWRAQLLVFCLAFLAVASRRPDALFKPQFFGEDGPVWFANAYNWGWWHALSLPQTGFYQTLPRLAAALALLVPLRFAPLIMNLVGITIQVLPINVLLSSRCINWGSLGIRALFAFAYLALPNSYELNATVEEAQWHLALLACLLVLSSSLPPNSAWRIFDLCVILLSGFTGPFCIVLAPIAVILWWMRRETWRAITAIALMLPAAVQLVTIYQTARTTRPAVGLGATVPTFIRMLAGHVYLGVLLGGNRFAIRGNIVLLVLVASAGTAILIYCLTHAQLELKLFLIFAIVIFALSLKSPMVSMDRPQWPVLASQAGIRYWFFPMLAFAWALIWCATQGTSRPWQWMSRAVLVIMCVGAARDWKYQPYTDHHFRDYARQFATAPAGSLFVIPIYPDGVHLKLSKKGSGCATMPIGELDTPSPNAKVSGRIEVTGWALSPERLKQVSVFIDQSQLRTVGLSVPRPDVDIHYPRSPEKNKGWRASVDTSVLTLGKHTLRVWVRDVSGCEAEIAASSIERVP